MRKEERVKTMINNELMETIKTLKAASRTSGKQIWRALAKELDRPKRRRVAVNLSRISRHTGEGQIVAVPGKVLASGSLSHPVTVAAYDFSETAREKIRLAKGRALTLRELLEEGVEPSMITILK